MSGGDIGDIGTSVAGSKNAVENNSLSVDNARKDLKSITEDLKQKVRDTGGENQVTAYINGAVIIASELGDAGLATVDTAFDVLALITTCALGDSYCSQAKADYAKINGTIAANVDALFISGKAWTEIGKMLDKANNGDQVAQENTIALMASILSPSKLVSGKIVNGVTKVEELITNTNKINKVENVIADASTVNKIEKGLSEPVPLGANLIGKDDPLAKAATLIKPQEGYFDVVIHGSSDSFSVLLDGKWVNLDQRSLATFVQKNNYNGESIRLISCSTGACSTSIAQDLSNKLGTKVVAPSDTIWIHPNGNMTIGDNPLINTGKWNTFNPGENLK